MEINYITKPLTVTEMKLQMNEDRIITTNIKIHSSDIIGITLDDFLFMLSRRVTNTDMLMDINYSIVGLANTDELIIKVSGDVDTIIHIEDDPQLEVHHEFYEFDSAEEMEKHLKYWSNATGDLHEHGTHDIEDPSELPKELQIAYKLLYEEGNGCLEYLVEYNDRYYVALANEFGENFALQHELSMKELYKTLKKKALNLYHQKEFQNTICIMRNENKTSSLSHNFHEVIFLIPAMASKNTYDTIEDILYRTKWAVRKQEE